MKAVAHVVNVVTITYCVPRRIVDIVPSLLITSILDSEYRSVQVAQYVITLLAQFWKKRENSTMMLNSTCNVTIQGNQRNKSEVSKLKSEGEQRDIT